MLFRHFYPFLATAFSSPQTETPHASNNNALVVLPTHTLSFCYFILIMINSLCSFHTRPFLFVLGCQGGGGGGLRFHSCFLCKLFSGSFFVVTFTCDTSLAQHLLKLSSTQHSTQLHLSSILAHITHGYIFTHHGSKIETHIYICDSLQLYTQQKYIIILRAYRLIFLKYSLQRLLFLVSILCQLGKSTDI